VHCGSDLVLSVSAEAVAATAEGVPLLVSSDAPAGAYLTYEYGGDELPATAQTWNLTPPPGEWTLSGMTLELEGPEVAVTVVDPFGFWNDATLEDFGCEIGGMPSWAISGASGATPEEAIEGLMAQFNDGGHEPALTRAVHAEAGYPEAASQEWILGSDDATDVVAVVDESESGYFAWPDAICVSVPWPSS